MAVPRLRVPSVHRAGRCGRPRGSSPTRSSSTTARTRRCCGRRARRCCACSSRRTLDELEPAPARRHERAGPRRVPVRDAPPAGRHLEGAPDRDGPGGRGVPPPRDRRPRELGRPRGARPPPLVVRQRHGHDGRAARLDLRPRRPDPDARRLPDRVEQAACAGARDRAPRRRRARPRGLRRGVRRRRGRLDPHPRGLGRLAQRLPRRGRRPPAEPAHPDARRLPGRLRAHDPPLVAPIRAEMDEQGLADRPIYFVSSNPHSLVNLVTDTARSREAEIVALIEDARPRVPARGARALPRGPRRGLVGELPLLRRAAVVGRPARGRRRVAAARWRASARSA